MRHIWGYVNARDAREIPERYVCKHRAVLELHSPSRDGDGFAGVWPYVCVFFFFRHFFPAAVHEIIIARRNGKSAYRCGRSMRERTRVRQWVKNIGMDEVLGWLFLWSRCGLCGGGEGCVQLWFFVRWLVSGQGRREGVDYAYRSFLDFFFYIRIRGFFRVYWNDFYILILKSVFVKNIILFDRVAIILYFKFLL